MNYLYKFLNLFSSSNSQQFEFNPLTSSRQPPITHTIERRELENHELNIQDALNIDIHFYYYLLCNKDKLISTVLVG